MHQDDTGEDNSPFPTEYTNDATDNNFFQHLNNNFPNHLDFATPHISLHALIGNATMETLKISGTIKNKEIAIILMEEEHTISYKIGLSNT